MSDLMLFLQLFTQTHMDILVFLYRLSSYKKSRKPSSRSSDVGYSSPELTDKNLLGDDFGKEKYVSNRPYPGTRE